MRVGKQEEEVAEPAEAVTPTAEGEGVTFGAQEEGD